MEGSGAYVLKNQAAGAGTNINYSVGSGGAGNTIANDGNPGSPGTASTVTTYHFQQEEGKLAQTTKQQHQEELLQEET